MVTHIVLQLPKMANCSNSLKARYTWGSIDHGKLGHHTETIGEKKLVREYFQRSATHNYVSEPTMVVGISGVTMVACGPQYTV